MPRADTGLRLWRIVAEFDGERQGSDPASRPSRATGPEYLRRASPDRGWAGAPHDH